MVANKLIKRLDSSQWSVTVVDKNDIHDYQPGYLFIPFWMKADRVTKDRRDFLPTGVEFVEAAVATVDPHTREVHLKDDRTLAYDWLIIASGTRPDPARRSGGHRRHLACPG